MDATKEKTMYDKQINAFLFAAFHQRCQADALLMIQRADALACMHLVSADCQQIGMQLFRDPLRRKFCIAAQGKVYDGCSHVLPPAVDCFTK